jgi:hypothetical protein
MSSVPWVCLTDHDREDRNVVMSDASEVGRGADEREAVTPPMSRQGHE